MITTCTPIVAVFSDHSAATAAVKELVDSGFRAKEVGVVMQDVVRKQNGTSTGANSNEGDYSAEGALVGLAAGAGIGGLVGLGIVSGIFPVVGPVLMAGAMSVMAANVASGAALGGIVGALTNVGISEEHARHYESAVAAGKTVVAVSTDDHRQEARAILSRHGAEMKAADE